MNDARGSRLPFQWFPPFPLPLQFNERRSYTPAGALDSAFSNTSVLPVPTVATM